MMGDLNPKELSGVGEDDNCAALAVYNWLNSSSISYPGLNDVEYDSVSPIESADDRDCLTSIQNNSSNVAESESVLSDDFYSILGHIQENDRGHVQCSPLDEVRVKGDEGVDVLTPTVENSLAESAGPSSSSSPVQAVQSGPTGGLLSDFHNTGRIIGLVPGETVRYSDGDPTPYVFEEETNQRTLDKSVTYGDQKIPISTWIRAIDLMTEINVIPAAGVLFEFVFSKEEIQTCTLNGDKKGRGVLCKTKIQQIYDIVGWMKFNHSKPYPPSWNFSDIGIEEFQLTKNEKDLIKKKIFTEKRSQLKRCLDGKGKKSDTKAPNKTELSAVVVGKLCSIVGGEELI